MCCDERSILPAKRNCIKRHHVFTNVLRRRIIASFLSTGVVALPFAAVASIVAHMGDPAYGQRLIPTLVDEMAISIPDHIYALIPRNPDFTGGFDQVTSRTLARAVNRAAFWIDGKLGKSCKFETIAYLGPSKPYVLEKGCC